ncbi:MCE family protein [Terriglobus albidus]|uniref:MCE family protein n=1 Tax=Terriglobus albidus TaxID=1592106 RepID=A0A5B9E9K7_9BACT|nr:MlaD family protein [Terriglobus albidus]QEE28903.1 MCE family protein [Terriglobus albidus]
MSKRYFVVGLFIIAGLTLFAIGIFLVGNRHEAFSRHLMIYSEFVDLDGLAKGSKVRVAGMDAGQVTRIDVPGSPDSRFLVQMRINEQLRGLVRSDSIVTVDTEGVVGETFLSIHPGSANAPIAQADSVLASKPAVAMSDLLTRGLVVMNDADTALKQVSGKLGVTLDGVNGAVGNANNLLVGLKQGQGTVGMLLKDEKVAGQIRLAISDVQSATSNLNQASIHVNNLMGDVQQRQLPQKLDDTLTQVRSATAEASTTVQQVHKTLDQALGPDTNGITAGQNISQTLTNINVATSNMAEDTEALKRNFFFKGFFKRRGYYSLASLSPKEYRQSKLFANVNNHRSWLSADHLFRQGPQSPEELTAEGRRLIDSAIAGYGDAVFQSPIVIEGYSDTPDQADQLDSSYRRAQLVRVYLEARFPFATKNLGMISLGGTPPPGLDHDRWSGVCLLVMQKRQ